MRTYEMEDLFLMYNNKRKFAFVLSTKGGKRFLYKVEQANSPTLHYVHVAINKKWTYVGVLSYGNFQLTKNSKLRFNEPEVHIFGKVWDRVMANIPLQNYMTAYAPVRCSECGHWLYDLQSVENGIGAHCAKKMQNKPESIGATLRRLDKRISAMEQHA